MTTPGVAITELRRPEEQPAGVRLLVDLRPLQEPERLPVSAAYLERLLGAYASVPIAGEEIVALLRALRPDPTPPFVEAGLDVVARRWLVPLSRVPRAAAMAADALQVRVAQVRAGARDDDPVSGTVLHTTGGPSPIAERLPVVTSLLDLAAWELPERYARTRAARMARRMREGALLRASRVLVGSRATADAASSLVGIPADRLVVVPFAPDPAFISDKEPARLSRIRAELGIPERYLLVGGRFDARSDLPTVLAALAVLRSSEPAVESPVDWPPTLVLVGAVGDEGGSRVAGLAERHGVADLVRLLPALSAAEHATLAAGSVAHVQPALSDAVGFAAIDALAVGAPVIASRTGPLPEIVGPAGIVVEPRDPGRMAMALRAMWLDGPVAHQVRRTAQQRAATASRSWADVARDTRRAYEAAALDDAVG
jgi:glycosyltransferase involved in cell wall biosynthesis